MSYQELRGNIFSSRALAMVNTVNCVGVMGKGIALEFRRRYPEMFLAYKRTCDAHLLRPGQILPYFKQEPWVLNFAIKDDWKHSSKLAWIETCLQEFVGRYREWNIGSVAFPWMGAMNGGVAPEDIKRVTRQHLSQLQDIDVEVYDFDPAASDPLFDRLKVIVAQDDTREFARASGIRTTYVDRIIAAVSHSGATSFTTLAESAGIGGITVDKLYDYIMRARPTSSDTGGDVRPQQLRLC